MMNKTNKQIRVRIAPSPTGFLHLGTARTALFNWLFAKHNGGIFVLRIEDTDLLRSDSKFERDIIEGLSWLGINWDEGPIPFSQSENGNSQFPIPNLQKSYNVNFGPYRQSERLDIYEKYLNQLLKEQKAYYCYCTKDELEGERQALLAQGLSPKYSGKCRSYTLPPDGKKPELIRFKVAEKNVEFIDMIRGKISFDTRLIGDIAIAKIVPLKHSSVKQMSVRAIQKDKLLGFSPLYNFAVTVDDATMEISHIIRGEDHIPNTPKQILIQEALGFETPIYAHLPLILSADRSKLSKRYAETSLLMYRDQGYLPEALTNFIAFLGWHPKDEKEVMSLDELAKEFDISRIQKSGAIFNEEKLSWLNAKHIKNLKDSELINIIMPRITEKGISVTEAVLQKIINIEKDRMRTINDFFTLSDFFFDLPEYDSELLIWKTTPKDKIRENLQKVNQIVTNLKDSDINSADLETALSFAVKELGKGEVLWPLRASLSGRRESPGPYEIAEILGKAETVRRLEIAIEKLI